MSLSPAELELLQQRALRVREHVIRLATNGGCFLGASLSCADVIVYLYSHFLNVKTGNLDDPARDYLFLSKGHDVPALYAMFVELGWLEAARLRNHLQTCDVIYWHPNRDIPGVEFHSGSLGHLLAVAAGVAYDCKLRQQRNKIVVLLGDGELNEGSVWETCLVAAALRLENLIAIVDRNGFQANLPTEELVPLEPLADKFRAFGWRVAQADGHDFVSLHRALTGWPLAGGQPQVLIAETVRGKGLPSLEGRADRWFCDFSSREIEALLRELHGEEVEDLTATALTVR
ncbi:MAG: thiamine pyrophosphate-dependent enzyme [candidate division KSB1 bacterium]|nr:thiamine pyrophosphate-dependent enzyme [candidate division KSB1 bacterium]MDZ7276176.1 thiamine pyrophosphate-dependent enzyme [candidate division KSB1 bacterium]MDZ7287044.1 thiamine pyrophosphate-dependent enzyme [candidate division KSB1 bacterium]MDZ7297031.1 thiamine pyrophosphate-dependent enzyme [candidate division KSB1 bacterium]MDZ7309366.1 thiamine pyrophosphate-dependent enzyme [candidate division KSB1 bacterium]